MTIIFCLACNKHYVQNNAVSVLDTEITEDGHTDMHGITRKVRQHDYKRRRHTYTETTRVVLVTVTLWWHTHIQRRPELYSLRLRYGGTHIYRDDQSCTRYGYVMVAHTYTETTRVVLITVTLWWHTHIYRDDQSCTRYSYVMVAHTYTETTRIVLVTVTLWWHTHTYTEMTRVVLVTITLWWHTHC